MSNDSDSDLPDLQPHRSTHAGPKVRKFFRLLGFESGGDDE